MNTKYFVNTILADVFHTAAGTPGTNAVPTAYYLGLGSTASGNLKELTPSGNLGYQRIPLNGSLDAPNNGEITNSTDLSFPESQADWNVISGNPAPITHYMIFDAQNAGNKLMHGQLIKSRIAEQNTVITILQGQLRITLTPSE